MKSDGDIFHSGRVPPEPVSEPDTEEHTEIKEESMSEIDMKDTEEWPEESVSESDTEKKKHRRLLFLFQLLAVCILIAAVFGIGRIFLRDYKADSEYASLQDQYVSSVSDSDTEEEESLDALLRVIDFDSLQATNPEITAWIYIPDTQIDYPVCQGTDDTYYLTHTASGTSNANGAIFQYANGSLDEAAVHFFGHNMRSGAMFGQLKKYRDDTFLTEHPYVYVYTPEVSYRAAVFSACEVDADSAAYETGYVLGTEEYGQWVSETFPIREASGITSVSKDTKVFILSTCVGNKASRRYIVCAAVDKFRVRVGHGE